LTNKESQTQTGTLL